MAKCASCGREIGFSFGKKLCRWCVEYEANKRGEGKEKDNEYQRVMPTPWKGAQTFSGSFNQLFIGINVLVFAAMVIKSGSFMDFPGQQLVQWGSLYGPLAMGGQPWRLITYMFMHGGIIHIALNMWCLWNLGALAESLYDDWLYAVIYLLTGIGGGIFSLWWHPYTNTVGASGAVFGVAGALIASLKLGEFSLPRPMIASTFRSVLVFAGYNLIFGAVGSGVDNACHIGGLLIGLLCGALVAVMAPDREHLFRRMAICLTVLALLLGLGQLVVRSRGYVVLAARGSDLMQQGKTDEAIAVLERASKIHPELADAHLDLAHAYYLKGNYQKAAEELRRTLSLDPHNQVALYFLGHTQLNNNELDEAQKTFTLLLNENFRSPDAHIGLGYVAASQGKPDLAIEEYRKALGLDPEASEAYYGLGVTFNKLKQYDNAIAAIRKYQAIEQGTDYRSEIVLAEAYQGKGMTAEAAEANKKAKQLKPN